MSSDRFGWLASLAASSGARVVLLAFLVLLLQIPIGMIGGLVAEREQTRNRAAAEIARIWGGRQDVVGPFLVVPYRLRNKTAGGWQLADPIHHQLFLPERLRVEADVRVEHRSRGIFSLPVYTARVTLRGSLPRIDFAALGLEAEAMLDKAQLLLRVSDIRAVEALPTLRWNGGDRSFDPFTEQFGEANGLQALLSDLAPEGGDFTITLSVRGTGGLYFAPLGRQTEVAMSSNWPHPSFQGAWPPKDHDIGAGGFSAFWSIPSIARGFPSSWQQGGVPQSALQASYFGVDLFHPVDPYRMSHRSLKYAALFIGLTFLAVWLFEVRSGVRAHPVQYLLVGAAVCLFYLLELSLAEHFGFAAAYALASMAVVAQIGFYSRTVLRAWARAAVIAALSALLYGLLYVLLRAEDYALLAGSTGLFVALSAVMFLTRGVRWGARGTPPPASTGTSAATPEWRSL